MEIFAVLFKSGEHFLYLYLFLNPSPCNSSLNLYLVALWADTVVDKSPTKYLPVLLRFTMWKMWSGLRIALVFILNLWCLLFPAAVPFSTKRLENVAIDVCKRQRPCSGRFTWLCFRGLSNNLCSRGSSADGSAVTASKRTSLLWSALSDNHSLLFGSCPLLQSEALSLQP